jgi:hypothetical protein
MPTTPPSFARKFYGKSTNRGKAKAFKIKSIPECHVHRTSCRPECRAVAFPFFTLIGLNTGSKAVFCQGLGLQYLYFTGFFGLLFYPFFLGSFFVFFLYFKTLTKGPQVINS